MACIVFIGFTNGEYHVAFVGYKEFCFAFDGCIGFTNKEYHVVCVDFIIPRGGGRRDREGFANPSLPLQHLSTLPGVAAAAGTLPLTAMDCTNIACPIPVSWYRLRFRILCFDCVFRFSFVLMEDRRCLFGLYRSVRITADRDNCSNYVLPISGCFSMTEYRRWRGFVSHVSLYW